MRKGKGYNCHRNKNMLVGNQRGNLSRALSTALWSLEVPNEPGDITPSCSAHRWKDERKKTGLTLHKASIVKFPVPANMRAQGWRKLVRMSDVCLRP